MKNPKGEQEKTEPRLEEETSIKKTQIGRSLESNLNTIEILYTIPKNSDIKIRKFSYGEMKREAFVVYISSITDGQKIDEHIIRPLLNNTTSTDDDDVDIENVITAETITTVNVVGEAVKGVNSGNAVVFIEGKDCAYIISTSKFEGRGIEKAENEVVIKGSKEAFNEMANSNISLLRKRIKNESLIVESSIISKRSNNEVYLLYIKDLANEEILKDVRERIGSLDVDAIQNAAVLEQYIEERQKSLLPTVLYTERPDRTASFLENGFIVLVMDNSPEALIVPATFWSFFHNAEDHYLRFVFGNFIRALRLLALFITLFISAIYISVTNYHVEMVPADLLLAISATREIVPFPAIVEILLMEIAFELIREAGLRVPSPIGPTIGIVGALILGQAAVQANIVSPLVVIIVALGGLSSFAIGDISMNFSIRLIRFLFIFSAAFFGFYGMTALFTVGIVYLVSMKSFGVPYLAPMTPTYVSSKDTIFRRMLKNEILRPGYLKPKDLEKKSGE
ncbi:spore germination protein [Ureibacillus sinduriensis]|uniref:Spore gernimation protein KA n=1 Tax=Ureibacillus sinduriensis BLB-1 = JCM 15800 TaxID=1384057 RepID=A0A0A3HXT0_9BACL|nr:spore germination protein [Ureibacillus sinduriensis]KGR76040.1 spore gernimation protein KA [Ureibacillus sinduriensis BLB-1 = JCM 15800]